jgi:hypothetical protein
MSAKRISVTVSVDDRKVTLEGPEDFVRAEVQRITTPMGNNPTPGSSENGRQAMPQSEKDMIAAKRPQNHSETVAVLGFCLTESGQAEFSEADIKKAYLRAGVRPPKVISQSLRDAKNLFDLIETGSKRGTYKLSHHGDRTVRYDMPRGGGQ